MFVLSKEIIIFFTEYIKKIPLGAKDTVERLRANYHDILSFVRTKITQYEKGVDQLRSEVKLVKEKDLKSLTSRISDNRNAIKDSRKQVK